MKIKKTLNLINYNNQTNKKKHLSKRQFLHLKNQFFQYNKNPLSIEKALIKKKSKANNQRNNKMSEV